MNTLTTNWEDEENNRRIELLVEYRLAGNDVVIDSVTPLSVTFVDRQVRVWTQRGRQLLAQTVDRVAGLEWVKSQVLEAVAAAA